MRGLEEIKTINDDPYAHFLGREPQHFGTHERKGRDPETFTKHPALGAPYDKAINSLLAEIAAHAFVDLLVKSSAKPRTLGDRSRLNDKGDRAQHLGMEGIQSAIDAAPPFLKFWQKLNDEREARGEPEAGYGIAREAFTGGPTPDGALAFIGKKWDGVRAVPTTGRSYHGEFRQVSDEGTVWRVVANNQGPMFYASPEAALGGALHAKNHSELNS